MEIGTRVLVRAELPYTGVDAERLHAGKFEAEAVVAFPALAPPPKTPKSKVALDPARIAELAAIVASRHAQLVRTRDGVTIAPAVGSLVLGYTRGVHRVVGAGTHPQGEPLVYYEPVLTSALKRKAGPVEHCALVFCSELPDEVRDEVTALAQIPL